MPSPMKHDALARKPPCETFHESCPSEKTFFVRYPGKAAIY